MLTSQRLAATARCVLDAALARGLTITTAESCTGGMAAAALTDIAGSSAVFDRGFITYSNSSKSDLLGVSEAVLLRYGAVSAQTATLMATGALARSRADVAVSVTGVAGPGGGSDDKPVGLVWFCVARRSDRPRCERRNFGGADRSVVRLQAAQTALSLLLRAIQDGSFQDR